MRSSFFVLFISLCFCTSAQSEEDYSDADLRNFLRINQELQEAREAQIRQFDSLFTVLPIDMQLWDEMQYDYRQFKNVDSLKTKYSDQEFEVFYYLMSYRQNQRDEFPNILKKIEEKYGMSDDFFQHLNMRVQNIPSLRERLTNIQIKN
jgi:hypothetical protein